MKELMEITYALAKVLRKYQARYVGTPQAKKHHAEGEKALKRFSEFQSLHKSDEEILEWAHRNGFDRFSPSALRTAFEDAVSL